MSYDYDREGKPVGIGFTDSLPMTEAAARVAGETWLREWGEVYEQDSVSVTYFDAGHRERQLLVEPARDLFELIAHRAASVGALRAAYVERMILEGHDRVDLPNDHGGTTTFLLPSWWREPRKRIKVAWFRWRHRHPRAGEKFWRALRYCGTVWSAGVIDR